MAISLHAVSPVGRIIAACATLILIALTIQNHRARPLLPKSSLEVEEIRIQGRFNEVRTSLGLPLLPDIITVNITSTATPTPTKPRAVSRIDFRRRKRAFSSNSDKDEQLEDQPILHFALDALLQPQVSLDELVKSYRSLALAEKEVHSGKAGPRQDGRTARKARPVGGN